MEDALYDSRAVLGIVRISLRETAARRDDDPELSALAGTTRPGRRLTGRDHPISRVPRPPAAARQRDPEMHQVNKGNQWYFWMKLHNEVDAVAGLIHLVATAANVADITRVSQLLCGGETPVWGDRLADRSAAARATAAQAERRKASIRAKVEHLFL